MSIGIKTATGDVKIHSVHVTPSTAEKTITANGMYDASDDGVDGYSSVSVNIADQFPTLDDYVTANIRSKDGNISLTPHFYVINKNSNKIYGTCGSNIGFQELDTSPMYGWVIESGSLNTAYRLCMLTDSSHPNMFRFDNDGGLPYCNDIDAYSKFYINNPQTFKARTISTVSAPEAFKFLEDEGAYDLPEKVPVTSAFKMQLAATDNIMVLKLQNRTVPYLVRLLNGAVPTITMDSGKYLINIPSSVRWHYPGYYSDTMMTSSSGLSNGEERVYDSIGPYSREDFSNFFQNNALLTFDLTYNGEVLTHANATIDDFLWEV